MKEMNCNFKYMKCTVAAITTSAAETVISSRRDRLNNSMVLCANESTAR